MTTALSELSNLWSRFQTMSAFVGVEGKYLPNGVSCDDYGYGRLDAWDEIEALQDDNDPNVTLMKAAVLLNSGNVQHDGKGGDIMRAMAIRRYLALVECLLADALKGADSNLEPISDEMKRCAYLTISDFLRVEAAREEVELWEFLRGGGDLSDDSRTEVHRQVYKAWLRNFCADERVAAE